MKNLTPILMIVLLTGLSTGLRAENWPSWRGPNFNGVAEQGNYPVEWGPEKNVKWKVELPAFGSSTPAVWGEQIFVTSPLKDENMVLCFNLQGKKLWEQKIGQQRGGKHKMGSGSNPSPVTDGKHVWVYFKSGDFACLDFGG